MRTIRIYQQGSFKAGMQVYLDKDALKHVVTVLRMQPGQELIIFADNYEHLAKIITANKKEVKVLIEAVNFVSRESPRNIHLAQSIAKGERMELVIQKAVELGISSITPIITERTVVKLDSTRMEKKLNHWQAIAIAACEQCGRNIIPTINNIKTFDEYVNHVHQGHKYILSLKNSRSLKTLEFQNNDAITILIGPEGGFSQNELELAKDKQFIAISLGPRILRTETAAISAITLLQALAGDLCYN